MSKDKHNCLWCDNWNLDIKTIETYNACMCKESINHNKITMYYDTCACFTFPL